MPDIIKLGIDFVKKNKTYPGMSDMIAMGVKRDTIRHYFGNLSGFHDKLYPKCKEYFFDISKETQEKLNVSKYKTFVITTAITGDIVDNNSLASLKTYCRKFGAKLIVQVAKGNQKLGQTLDPSLRGEYISLTDINLNNNIKLLSVFQSGAKTDPTSGGISRTGKRDSSIILASPKQRLLYTATGMDALPHATMGTGAITFPKYEKSKMTGYVADHDHIMGAIIVEVKDKEIFHFRQIQFDKQGRLVDLGVLIDGNKISRMAPSAMVLGDWHAGKGDPVVIKASIEISKKLGIKEWVLHDVFDGDSISHHDMGKLLLLSRKATTGRLNLEDELKILTSDLSDMDKFLTKITIVKSNHDEHLERYLDEGRFMKHPYNTKLSIELAAAMLKDENPVEYATKKFGLKSKKVKWLKRDESYKIAGIECGAHGDKGANGSRGSAQSMEKAFGKCIYGHSHSPGILRDAWCVGTTTLPWADYGAGPSSWMNTHCLVYPNGMRQMLNFIGGECSIR